MGGFAIQSFFRICQTPQTLKRFSSGCGDLGAALLHVLGCTKRIARKGRRHACPMACGNPQKPCSALPEIMKAQGSVRRRRPKRLRLGFLGSGSPQARGIKRKCPFQANLANNAVPLWFYNLKKGMAAPARCVLRPKMQTEQRAQMPEPASSHGLKLEANASFWMCQTCKALCCGRWHTIPAVPKAQKTRTALRFPGNQRAARKPPSLQGLRPPYAPGKCSDFCETDPRPLMDCVTTGAP